MTARIAVIPLLLAALLEPLPSAAAAPVLYSAPHLQSPVRGEPGGLVLIPGFGFAEGDRVIYALLSGTLDAPARPADPPAQSTAEQGIAPVVSRDIPYSVTVALPDAMLPDRPYALWVQTAGGEFSAPIRINDARPLWISPAAAYASAETATLPRSLKVVGRNLMSAPDGATRIRLRGQQDVFLTAERTGSALDRYVAAASLPELVPGAYEVSVSTDGRNWLTVTNQRLEVRPDPPAPREVSLPSDRFGACVPDDGLDDTDCIRRAIALAGEGDRGGRAILGAGTWDLEPGLHGELGPDGIVLPSGVALTGAGPDATTLLRHASDRGRRAAAFTLTSANFVSGLRFKDSERYVSVDDAGPFLKLGSDAAVDLQAVRDVAIVRNVFDNTHVGLAAAPVPVERLIVAHNEFGGFVEGIGLHGDRFDVHHRFQLVDSVIAYNSFKPGSLADFGSGAGTVAAEIGGSRRVDFSHNRADGAAVDYIYPDQPARGWRAAFFWHLNENHELLLVSDNTATCTGDRFGDGEAFAFDNNGNTFGLDSAATALDADAGSVTISGMLRTLQNGRDVPVDEYYVGHWIQVGAGPGRGQARKIVSYRRSGEGDAITFAIAPSWDVIPEPGITRISIGREFWQVYAVGNTVDNRQPLCTKGNRSWPKGGAISLWAQSADFVIEGNLQYDTDGILFFNQYTDRNPGSRCADCDRGTAYTSSLAIVGNSIRGEFDADDACSSSGIIGELAAGPDRPPLTTGTGITIANNEIVGADARHGGAIAFSNGWYAGPEPHRWPLVSGILIFGNSIGDLPKQSRRCGTDPPLRREAVNLAVSSLVDDLTLHANSCAGDGCGSTRQVQAR